MTNSSVELTLDERKTVLLELLTKIQLILAEHDLLYTAYYGTLLGSIRHNGFIPWDDDIDLAMKREYYERMIKIDWEKYGLELIAPGVSEDCPYPFSKISDPNFICIENVQTGIPATGLNIDIFPLDNIYGILPWSINFLKWLVLFKVIKDNSSRRLWKRMILIVVRFLMKPIRVGQLTFLIDSLCKLSIDKNSKELGCLVGPYGNKDKFKKECLDSIKSTKFESLTLSVPSSYDAPLKAIYGDYMKLPPVEKRTSHHANKVYRKLLEL